MTHESDPVSAAGSPESPVQTAIPAPRNDDEVTLLELATVLLERWKLIIGLPLLAGIVAAALSVVIPARYRATASFVPESGSQGPQITGGLAALAGFASQFGVELTGSATSPQFYEKVVQSRTIADRVLLTLYPDPREAPPVDSATLLEILEVRGRTPGKRLERGRKALERRTSTSVDGRTKIVTISVTTRYPSLSAQVANRYLALVNEFNLSTRKSNAYEQRRFIEQRLADARTELRTAEERLQQFLERNRRYQSSPELLFEHDRLEREVLLKQDVLTTLGREYEEARIQEVNDTPLLTVIDQAVPPARKSSPRLVLNVVAAVLLIGALAALGALLQTYARRNRRRDRANYHEFTARWRQTKAELRGLLTRSR